MVAAVALLVDSFWGPTGIRSAALSLLHDLPEWVSCHCCLCTDDMLLYQNIESESDCVRLQADLCAELESDCVRLQADLSAPHEI